jgi:hypothetical protein
MSPVETLAFIAGLVGTPALIVTLIAFYWRTVQ